MIFLLNIIDIFIEFFGLFLEGFVHSLFTVSDDNYIRLSGVHLIQGVHQEGESIVVKDKQKDNSLLGLVAGNESNRSMFHFASTQSLGVNIV